MHVQADRRAGFDESHNFESCAQRSVRRRDPRLWRDWHGGVAVFGLQRSKCTQILQTG